MAEVQIAYGEDGSIIIGKPVSGCWYAVADVLDVFPYGTGEFLREVIQEKSVAVVLDQGSFGGSSDKPEDFEKVLWGQNKSYTITYLVDHCVMTYQDVQRLFSLCGARAKQIKNMLETAKKVTDEDVVTSSLREQLSEVRTEVSRLRVQLQMEKKKLEERNAAFQELCVKKEQAESESEKLRARIAELEENVAARSYSLPTNIQTTLRLLTSGKTDEEIAKFFFQAEGKGMSRAQIGALLYRGREERPKANTLQGVGGDLVLAMKNLPRSGR